MIAIKPKSNKYADCLEPFSDFFKLSHAYDAPGLPEHTLCGIACEEWGYTNYTEVKKITCPECRAIIQACKSFKG